MNSKIIICKNEIFSHIESDFLSLSMHCMTSLPCLSLSMCLPHSLNTLFPYFSLLPLLFTLLWETYFLSNACPCVPSCFLPEKVSTFEGVLWPTLALSLAGLSALKEELSLILTPFLPNPMLSWLNCVPLKRTC